MRSEGPKIGQIINDKGAERDSVHVNVLPVIAGDYLNPGQHVGIGPYEPYTSSSHSKHIGIVDPFLKGSVMRGQQFYLFLYPNTVTGMRHHWEHPEVHPDFKPAIPEHKKASVEWMTNLADEYRVSYAWLMDKADGIAKEVDDYIIFPVDCHSGDIDPREFWNHYEVIRGRRLNEEIDKGEFIFGCSCG